MIFEIIKPCKEKPEKWSRSLLCSRLPESEALDRTSIRKVIETSLPLNLRLSHLFSHYRMLQEGTTEKSGEEISRFF